MKALSLESLSAEVAQLRSSLAGLSEEATELSRQLSALAAAGAEATRLRKEERRAHGEAVVEARQAQQGLQEAMELLAKAFQQGEGAVRVLGLLKEVHGDFSRLEAEVKAAEEQGQRDFRAFQEESRLDEASKRSDAAHLAEQQVEQSRALAQREVDLAQVQSEPLGTAWHPKRRRTGMGMGGFRGRRPRLTQAQEYFEGLEKRCKSPESEEAKAKAWREKEIENLKTALKQLES